MSTISKAGMGLLAGVVFSLVSPSVGRADLDHFRGRRQTPDVDIEGLRANMRLERGQWLLSVSYRIEAEHFNPSSRLSLALSLDGGVSCSPISIVVPLLGPASCNRDEAVFQDTVTRAVPAALVSQAGRARLHAAVVQNGRVLERDSTAVNVPRIVHRFSPGHRDGAAVRFGGSVSVRGGRR